MMLGIAASSSMAVPIGRRSHSGESSVRNTAMPKLTGMPIKSAMNEVTTVPKIGTSAPNFSVTGFHSWLARKPGPNSWIAGQLPMTSDINIPTSNASTRKANIRVTLRNAKSYRCCRFRSVSGMLLRNMPSDREAPCGASSVRSTASILASHGRPCHKTLPDRFAARVLDLAFPFSLDQGHYLVRHGNVIQGERQLVAVFVRPVEELEHFLCIGGIRLALVHQNKGGASDGPAGFARLVGENLVKSGCIFPVGAGCCRLEALVVGGDKLTLPILQLSERQLVLLGVSVFDVADRGFEALHERGDPLIPLAARTGGGRPGHRGATADFVLPLRTYRGQGGGEDERGARAVRAVYHSDFGIRQLQALVKLGNRRIVSFLYI